ncbi:MAG: RNA methyltransferase [Hymenobacteraceae bacterium]|nr:RNA methyltransferase [Hymenobacteraceae bacterium]
MLRKLTLDELNRPTAADFQRQAKRPVCLVLDNVRSLANVGSAFRTADAFAIEKLWLCGITGTPPHKELLKTALGATETVPWEHAPDTAELLRKLKAAGYRSVAVELAAGAEQLDRFQFDPAEKLALVFGHEVFGVSDEALVECAAAVEIPQAGTKHSLNVSVAVGIVLWEVVSRGL